MVKQLYIIRHGETDLNLEGIVQGRGVDPPLNETGRKQATLFYDYYKDESFEIMYISSLRRTFESVQPFIEKNVPYEKHADLDEISWGVFEGKRAGTDFKALYRDLIECWNHGHLTKKRRTERVLLKYSKGNSGL